MTFPVDKLRELRDSIAERNGPDGHPDVQTLLCAMSDTLAEAERLQAEVDRLASELAEVKVRLGTAQTAYLAQAQELAEVRGDAAELLVARDSALRWLREKTEAYDALGTQANGYLLRACAAEADRDRLADTVRRYQPVIDAAKVRAQVIRDCAQYGSGSEGWYDRDRESDKAIVAAVDALDAQLPEMGEPGSNSGADDPIETGTEAALGEAEEKLRRVHELVESYPPGSDFARSGLQALFRRTLSTTAASPSDTESAARGRDEGDT